VSDFGRRTVITGSLPVAGLPRPLFLGVTDIDFTIYRCYSKCRTKARRTEMKRTETRKLRVDLTPAEREQAERIGRLPAGQRIKTAWSMRVEKFVPSRTQH
jgi:hypothetical protein